MVIVVCILPHTGLEDLVQLPYFLSGKSDFLIWRHKHAKQI